MIYNDISRSGRAYGQLPRLHLHAEDNVCWRTANFPVRTANFPDRICMPGTTFAGAQPTSQAAFACRGQRLLAYSQLPRAHGQLPRPHLHAANNIYWRTANFSRRPTVMNIYA